MGTDTRLHAFLNSAVDGAEWLASRSCRTSLDKALNNDVRCAVCTVYPQPSKVKPEAA
jgi:hypothetical protein